MNRRRIVGASYVEVLVATAILAVLLLPATEALYTGIRGAAIDESQAALYFRLNGRLEELLAEPFSKLDEEAVAIGSPTVPSPSYSDTAGTPDRRLVFLSRYDGDDDPSDGDPFTGVDEGLLWIRVEIEATALALERVHHDGG